MANSAEHSVSIIVLTWNQRDLTLECLDSLSALDYPADRLQIVVVDNGSTDDTARAIRTRHPGVTVLQNGANLGFAEGNNVGLRHVLQGQAGYVMLLNNDTTVDPAMLRELLAVMEGDPQAGIAGPKMLYHDRPDTIWCASSRIDRRTGASIRLQAEQADTGSDRAPGDADFITACAICLKRQVIEQIGLLDPRFYFYFEDADWCARARAAGWRIVYAPRARMWHKVSATIGSTSPATEYYMSRNALLFLAKHQRGWSRMCSLALSAGRSLLAAAAYTAKPHGGRRIPHRNARLLALRDAALGRWGQMGPDVSVACDSR